SARFPTTANQMLRSLQAATSTRAAGGSSESRGEQRPSSRNVESDPAPKGEAWRPAGTPAPLTQTAFPDNSGSVGLPAGWRFLEAAGGYALLEGPKRERVVMSSGFSAWDMRNPQTANTFRNGQLPGRYVSIPFGTDPATAYTAVVTQMAIKLQRQPPTVQISSTEKAVGPDGFPYMVLKGEQDLHDGVGMRDLLVHYYVMAQPDAQGTWFLILFQYLVPKGLMQQELPTLAAMRRSYRENGQVIQSQNQAQLARAHQSFQNSQDLNRARNQAFDAHMADLDRQSADRGAANDGQDKRNQAFSNYLLDRTAIVDTRTGAQGTVSSGFATSLMQADPNFESVPTENLLKGITY
ncbi:MAG: hypothetical protein ABJD11_06850, partial [Gemmatimonadota bacterium]